MRHPAASHGSPGPQTSGRGSWWLVGLGSLLACTNPAAQPQRLDRAIQTRAHRIEIPTARHSTLEALAPGVRIQLGDATIEVDDLSLWSTASPEALTALRAEGRTSWTHVRDVRLQIEPKDGDLVSIDEPLNEALSRARRTARAVLEAQDAVETLRVTFFAGADASFRDVVHVLYNAGQAELPESQLAFRHADGRLGSLPMSVPKYCAVRADPQKPNTDAARCHQFSLFVDEGTISLRGRNVPQSAGACGVAMGIQDAPADLSPLDGAVLPKPKPRPPDPCVIVGLEAVANEPSELRRAMQRLTDEVEPCRQVTLAASETTTWGQVLTTFDALWSQEHDLIFFETSSLRGRCESGPSDETP